MLLKSTTPVASLTRRKWGVVMPIHTKMILIIMNMPFLLINIYQYNVLVLISVSFANYNALAIVPSWGE